MKKGILQVRPPCPYPFICSTYIPNLLTPSSRILTWLEKRVFIRQSERIKLNYYHFFFEWLNLEINRFSETSLAYRVIIFQLINLRPLLKGRKYGAFYWNILPSLWKFEDPLRNLTKNQNLSVTIPTLTESPYNAPPSERRHVYTQFQRNAIKTPASMQIRPVFTTLLLTHISFPL